MKRFITFLAVLLIIYGVAYACIVQPSSTPEVTSMPPWVRAPQYAVSHDAVKTIFGPALQIDRKLFPKRWAFTGATVIDSLKK